MCTCTRTRTRTRNASRVTARRNRTFHRPHAQRCNTSAVRSPTRTRARARLLIRSCPVTKPNYREPLSTRVDSTLEAAIESVLEILSGRAGVDGGDLRVDRAGHDPQLRAIDCGGGAGPARARA